MSVVDDGVRALVAGTAGMALGGTIVAFSFFSIGPPPSSTKAPCIDSIVVANMSDPPYNVHIDTAALCANPRIPGPPEIRDGLLIVTCSCGAKK